MPDYTFTIKTPAELAGVEKAITRFEQLRGQAQANGKDFGELDQKIARARASIEAYQQSQAKAEQATKKVADESARYEAALKKHADAAREAADAEALAALKAEATAKASERKRVELEETIYAQSELGQLTRTITQQEVDALLQTGAAHEQAGAAADEHEVSARKVDKAFGALAATGGPLGRALNLLRELAGSPLTLGLAAGSIVVALITARWTKWREEIERTRQRLLEIEWSKLDGLRTALSNAATAQTDLNEAMADAAKQDDPIGKDFERRMAVLDAEIERKKNLLQLNEELEVSSLKAAGGTDAAEAAIRARYARARGGLEGTSDAAKLQELRNELAAREQREPQLRTAAQQARDAASLFPQTEGVRTAAAQLADAQKEAQRIAEEFGQAGGQAQLEKLQQLFDQADPEGELAGGIALKLVPLQKLKQQLDAANAALFGAQGAVDRNASRQTGLDNTASTAQSDFTSNAAAITALRERIGTATAVNQVRDQQRADESVFAAGRDAAGRGRGTEAQTILNAAAGADALLAGDQATQEQANAIAILVQRFNLNTQQQAAILRLLARLNDNDQNFATALKNLESKLGDSYNQ